METYQSGGPAVNPLCLGKVQISFGGGVPDCDVQFCASGGQLGVDPTVDRCLRDLGDL